MRNDFAKVRSEVKAPQERDFDPAYRPLRAEQTDQWLIARSDWDTSWKETATLSFLEDFDHRGVGCDEQRTDDPLHSHY
jgi:hypothetical protein